MSTEGYVDRGSDPAGALCELPRLFRGHSHRKATLFFCPDLGYIGCPDVRVRHQLRAGGGGWVVGVKIIILFSDTDNGQ